MSLLLLAVSIATLSRRFASTGAPCPCKSSCAMRASFSSESARHTSLMSTVPSEPRRQRYATKQLQQGSAAGGMGFDDCCVAAIPRTACPKGVVCHERRVSIMARNYTRDEGGPARMTAAQARVLGDEAGPPEARVHLGTPWRGRLGPDDQSIFAHWRLQT